MNRKRKTRFEVWYQENHAHFEELSSVCKQILEKVLKENKVLFLSVSARGKSVLSAVKKARDKDYRTPKRDMTDLAGIRVVTYTEDDAEKACEVVKRLFCVDAKKSGDKTVNLNKDKVGYRSFHFVCTMNEDRIKLPEFQKFSKRCFEIQVRTILQHAWAEIEHSRRYKFSGVLPPKLARSLNLTAGLLEVADKQLAQLAGAIDQYRAATREKAKKGNFRVSLNTLSIQTFLRGQKFPVSFEILPNHSHEQWVGLLEECSAFEIRSLRDLKRLMTKEFWSSFRTTREKTGLKTLSEIGLVRRVLAFSDLGKYLSVTKERRTAEEAVSMLSLKYPEASIKFQEAGFTILSNETIKAVELKLEKLLAESREEVETNTDEGLDEDIPYEDDDEGPSDDDDEGPSDDDDEGPSDDDDEGPTDDDDEGPTDDDDEGPTDDDDEGPTDDDDEGPSDDDDEGPSDDDDEGPSDDDDEGPLDDDDEGPSDDDDEAPPDKSPPVGTSNN
jgi:ppGpp synthetase/RelA/SpoT-type nucleotidyltranferase